MSQKTIKLSKVLPNPFRDMEHYPIQESKIEALMASMDRTGWWDNVVARPAGGGNVELAYGHHRWVAFRRKYGDDADITLIVKDWDDEAMLRAMADENMAEWGTSAEVEQETVRAVVLAYAAGKVSLERPKPRAKSGGNKVRVAPSFVATHAFNDLKSVDRPYNAESIATFLDWWSGDQVSPRVRNALDTLATKEEAAAVAPEVVDELEEATTTGMSSAQSKTATKAFKRLRATHEATGKSPKEAVKAAVKDTKKLADGLRGGKGIDHAEQQVSQRQSKLRQEKRPLPSAYAFCRQLAQELRGVFDRNKDFREKIKQLIAAKDDVPADSRKEVVDALYLVVKQCESVIVGLGGRGMGNGQN